MLNATQISRGFAFYILSSGWSWSWPGFRREWLHLDLRRPLPHALLPVGEACDVTAVLAGLKGHFAGRGLALLYDDRHFTVAMDRENLELVFSNLFDNAQRHGAAEATVGIRADEEHLHIIVRDNGS